MRIPSEATMRDSCWERYTWPLSRAHLTWERMKRYTALTTWDRAENGRLRRNVGLGHRRASSQCWLMGGTGRFPSNLKSRRRIHSHGSFHRRGSTALGSEATDYPALQTHAHMNTDGR